jgi:hypothetical protein
MQIHLHQVKILQIHNVAFGSGNIQHRPGYMSPYYLSRRGKYTTQTGYMSPYYLSKAYITKSVP